ncbi:MAG: class I SAM-dependent methyltransferase [Myxococcota bacterium]|nr:SAM-dependent methyltransferase [Myxococcota bacterium]
MKRLSVFLLPLAVACGHPSPVAPDAAAVKYTTIAEESDRTDEDKALDAGRHPVQLLELARVQPGMNVADLAAGSGYTTELLARAVAPTGKVYAQNPEMFIKFIGERWPERLARPANQNVVRVDREMESPLPPEAKELDVVIANLVYHDFVWMGVDRTAMNRAVLASLKRGGSYIVIDHAAAKGHGVDDVKALHRIEEESVIAEVTRAGFKLENKGEFLRNPEDTRDWSTSPSTVGEKRGTSDRFALRFIRP